VFGELVWLLELDDAPLLVMLLEPLALLVEDDGTMLPFKWPAELRKLLLGPVEAMLLIPMRLL